MIYPFIACDSFGAAAAYVKADSDGGGYSSPEVVGHRITGRK